MMYGPPTRNQALQALVSEHAEAALLRAIAAHDRKLDHDLLHGDGTDRQSGLFVTHNPMEAAVFSMQQAYLTVNGERLGLITGDFLDIDTPGVRDVLGDALDWPRDMPELGVTMKIRSIAAHDMDLTDLVRIHRERPAPRYPNKAAWKRAMKGRR